ncbi:uncharacterized protein LOC117002246 isoform X5 [Catharus ustulatus]|uniref:uncharacterized protein LOC117002246 isoform X5 n=1 Tax=Catharus ustulatus TaxID=91951 RepID=UPI001408AA7E|nr:uncharacterized protein LOC117002246 isoform X5 [Catharus ustulatus]
MGGGKGIKGHGMERERLGALVILGVLSLARGDPPDAANPFHYAAAARPRSCHLCLGQEPPARAELSPNVPKRGDTGGGRVRVYLGAELLSQMSPKCPQMSPECPWKGQ